MVSTTTVLSWSHAGLLACQALLIASATSNGKHRQAAAIGAARASIPERHDRLRRSNVFHPHDESSSGGSGSEVPDDKGNDGGLAARQYSERARRSSGGEKSILSPETGKSPNAQKKPQMPKAVSARQQPRDQPLKKRQKLTPREKCLSRGTCRYCTTPKLCRRVAESVNSKCEWKPWRDTTRERRRRRRDRGRLRKKGACVRRAASSPVGEEAPAPTLTPQLYGGGPVPLVYRCAPEGVVDVTDESLCDLYQDCSFDFLPACENCVLATACQQNLPSWCNDPGVYC